MAQPGSALDWGSRGRRFESCRSDHFLKGIGCLEGVAFGRPLFVFCLPPGWRRRTASTATRTDDFCRIPWLCWRSIGSGVGMYAKRYACAAFVVVSSCLIQGPSSAQVSVPIGGADLVDRRLPWERTRPLGSSSDISTPAREALPDAVEAILSSSVRSGGSLLVVGDVYVADQYLEFDELTFQDGGRLLLDPRHPYIVMAVDRIRLPALFEHAAIGYAPVDYRLDGADGPDGADGVGGGQRQVTTAGQNGAPGANGRDAPHRPRVYLAIEEISIGRDAMVPAAVAPRPVWRMNGLVYDISWVYPVHPLSLSFAGEAGGQGGRGGAGGDGGQGSRGRDASSDFFVVCRRGPGDGGTGGRGGNSGNGGRGGSGGNGTELVVIAPEQVLAHLRSMSISVDGGTGGQGGFPGPVGRGGRGGAPGEDREVACTGSKANPGRQGDLGTPGRAGRQGTAGRTYPIAYREVLPRPAETGQP